MQPQRQSQRVSKSNQNKRATVPSIESPSAEATKQLKKRTKSSPSGVTPPLKKSNPAYAPGSNTIYGMYPRTAPRSDKQMAETKKSKLAYAPGSNTRSGMYSSTAPRSGFTPPQGKITKNSSLALKSQKKQNTGKNVSTFESSSAVLKMKERTITPIKDINPMIANMALKGRCISVWHSHKLNEEHDPYSLDCVFQDEESNRIQIYIKKEFMFKFEPLLQEGQCYIISNFGVAENGGRLPLLHNRWKISFYKSTEVTRIEQIDDNFIGFVNEPFTRILDTNNEYHEHDCVDVIGTVVAIGNIISVNGYGCSKIRRTVVIEDAESLRLECTFWDKWALMWNEYANKLDQVGHLDFVLILAKIKYWNNKPAIHNALFGTRIFINKDIHPLVNFRKSYEAQNGYNASEFKIEVHNPDNHVVTPAEFMQGSVKKMVGMIRNIEPDTYCIVYATVHSIQYESGWAYTGCKECKTRVTAIASKGASGSRNKKQLWLCKKHGETYAVVSRFKIIVRIFDESGSAQVVIFDNNVYKMTKLSAWEIMEKQGMDADQYFPEELNQIIGKQYLFKVKYTEFNHNNNSHVYRAEKVTEDVETINYFKNGFFENEDEDNTSEENEMNEEQDEDYTSEANENEMNTAEEEDYTSEANENEMNTDAEDDFTSPSIEDNEDAIDDSTTPSIEINEVTANGMTSYDITTSNGQASKSEKNSETVIIDLSDYETEDEEEDCNPTKKLVTVKLEKDP